jgi:hypothetical protein
MRKFLLTACAFGLLLSSASAQEPNREETLNGVQKFEFTRHVPSGAKRAIDFVYGAYPDCSAMAVEEIEIRKVREPEHGAVEIAPGERFPSFAKDTCGISATRRSFAVLW